MADPERLELVCGFLGCDALPFNPVLTTLPALLRVRVRGDSSSRLSALLQFAVAESSPARPGSRSVLLRIAELVFVEVLRSYLTSASERSQLAGRTARPDRRPCVGATARRTGARVDIARARARGGCIAHWRMQLAAGLLAAGTASVSAVAGEVGYESEAAFCRAFKKVTGVTPASWRSRRHVEHS